MSTTDAEYIVISGAGMASPSVSSFACALFLLSEWREMICGAKGRVRVKTKKTF